MTSDANQPTAPDVQNGPLRVLLVEDNAGDAKLIQHMLEEVPEPRVELTTVDRLAKALTALGAGGVDLVLLDLALPDCAGLDTLRRTRERAGETPIIVLTGTADADLSLRAAQIGAQDYLVKDAVTPDLLMLAIRYCIERKRAFAHIEERRVRDQQDRELGSLERLSAGAPTNVTSTLFGTVSLRERRPDLYSGLLDQYGAILDLAIDQQIFKVDHRVSDKVRAVAERMGLLGGGPRDVLDLHTAALRRKTEGIPHFRARAYVEEGRVVVLELMGNLTSFYRNLSLTQRENVLEEPSEGRLDG